ncbi:MAG: hypothetical protein AAGJ39_04250 [Pseudomonadota bacterium]
MLLLRELGAAGAERVVDRAVDEISGRLLLIETSWASADFRTLGRTARSLIAVADQIGMHLLAHVSCDVAGLAETDDDTALAAAVARLQRVGESSLLAVWNAQAFRI